MYVLPIKTLILILANNKKLFLSHKHLHRNLWHFADALIWSHLEKCFEVSYEKMHPDSQRIQVLSVLNTVGEVV